MSANTIRKAKKLVESGGVSKIDDDLFQIKSSSDPDKSYFVTSDTCECTGFKNFYKFHHGKGQGKLFSFRSTQNLQARKLILDYFRFFALIFPTYALFFIITIGLNINPGYFTINLIS